MDIFYKLFDKLKDDLKKEYLSRPNVLWIFPVVVFDTQKNGVRIIDGKYPDDAVAEYLSKATKNDTIKCVIIGRMGVKRSGVIGADGQPIIKEKSIIIHGKNFLTNEFKTIIIPCKEHFDFRDKEEIEKDHKLIDLTFKSPDLSKFTTDEKGNEFHVTAKFGKEEEFSTKKGHKQLIDPLLDSLEKKQKILKDIEAMEKINESKNKLDGGNI